MSDEPEIRVQECGDCHGVFLPRPGSCPRCGSRKTVEARRPARGHVIAFTELAYPPPGFPSPHRLSLIELADSIRVLGTWEGPAISLGDEVVVRPTPTGYRAEPARPK
ncbi:MAG TPA: zinc ribbon domain-containing protein [Thermoplasmata archaeon]|nr:zinc ribbon domain-containing protein [Thermoplasmata archaeon]